jgi:hypothetical protein
LVNYTGLWWNPAEPGWGINVNHQDSNVFAVLFAYWIDGEATWFVAPNLALLLDGSFSGNVYLVDGGSPFGAPWTASGISLGGAGEMTIRFGGNDTATLTLGGVTKTIEKEIFSTPTTCGEGKGSRASLANYQDMWWDPAEPGWGLAIAHQGSTILAVLFTYDTQGHNTWFVGPDLQPAAGGFTGTLYSTKGPLFGSSPWTPISAAEVGSMSLTFGDGETGTLSYTVNGVAVTKPIQREVTGAVRPRCQ